MKKAKLVHIEILRILAIFFVIFNHTGKDGYFLFSEFSASSIRFWLYLFLSHFCKFAVPVFLAISGALVLSKPREPLKQLCKKNSKICRCFGKHFSAVLYCLHDSYA